VNALSAQTFTRITTGSIATDAGLSKAATWSDYNNDGNVDLFVPNTIFEDNFLYLNNGDGSFTKILSSTIVNDGGNAQTANSETATWGDFDNDGDLDVFISYNGPNNQLHRNNGDGTFTKITSGSIVNDGGGSRATASGDYNNDGFLDVFVANRFGENNFLYKNNGDGSFTKIISGPVVNDGGDSQGCAWADYDNDGFLDLLVTNASDNFLYNNNGDGTFTKITTSPILNYFGPGGSWGDYNNDGFLDLFITNSQQNEPNALFKNNGDGTFTRITEGSIVNDLGISRGSAWGDHDNDGDLDLVVANGVLVASENNFLYSNNGDGTFTKILSGPVVNDGGLSLSVGWADYDNDGDLDLFVGNTSEVNFLYKNNGNQNNWLNLKLIGTSSNTAAIGAKVRVKALIDGTETWQMREISGQTGRGGQNSLNAEFGLRDASVIDAIKVEWPSGIVQNLVNIPVNQFLTITEEKVACDPFDCPDAAVFPTNETGVLGERITGLTGEVVYIDIRLKENPNKIDAFGFTVQVEPTHLAFIEFLPGELTSGFKFLNAQESSAGSGEIICGGANPDPIPPASSGSLFRLGFRVIGGSGDSSIVTITSLTDDVAGFSACCNIVKFRGCKNDGDVDSNGVLTPADALCAFKIFLNHQILPAECGTSGFDCELTAADPNCDGQVTPGDALKIFKGYFNQQQPQHCFARSKVAYQLYQISLNQATIVSRKNNQDTDLVKVSFFIDNPEGIEAFGLSLSYPKDKLEFVVVEATELTGNWLQLGGSSEIPGEIIVGGFNTEPLMGGASGELFQVIFKSRDRSLSTIDFEITELVDDLKDALIESTSLELVAVPNQFSLYQNYPNPFNPETSISFDIPTMDKQKIQTTISIFNVSGQLVRILMKEAKTPGSYQIKWDGRDKRGLKVPSGLYLYSIRADKFEITKKMLLLK